MNAVLFIGPRVPGSLSPEVLDRLIALLAGITVFGGKSRLARHWPEGPPYVYIHTASSNELEFLPDMCPVS